MASAHTGIAGSARLASLGLPPAQLAPGQLWFAIRYHVGKKNEFSLSREGVLYSFEYSCFTFAREIHSFEFIL